MRWHFVLFFVLLLGAVFALSPNELNWNGFAQVYFDKEQFDSDEPITGNIYLTNLESYPLLDGRIVLQITQGEYSYPSQLSNNNINFEGVISDAWILPSSTKRFDFNLPSQKAGNYRLDVYAWATKSKLIGVSSILYNPLSKEFLVRGVEEKRAIINRAKTVFGKDNVAGPVGFLVNPSELVSGKVVVRNDTKTTQTDLELVVSLCNWATVFCENPKEYTFPLSSILQGEEKTIEVELNAPEVSSAYEIRLTLKQNEEIQSIYTNRIIVSGATAEIRKVFITGIENNNYGITTLLSGPSDEESEIAFDNFSIELEVYESGTKKEDKYESIESIGVGEILSKSFSLSSKSFDMICVIIKKEGNEYKKECFDIELNPIKLAYEKGLALPVNVEWSYSKSTSLLEVKLSKALINARIIILDNEKTLYEEKITSALLSVTKIYPVEQKNLTLVIDDFDVKKQQVFAITLDESTDLSAIEPVITVDENGTLIDSFCNDTLCGEGFVCAGATYKTNEGDCCIAKCVPSLERQLQTTLPFIVVTAIIFALIALVVVVSTYTRVRK